MKMEIALVAPGDWRIEPAVLRFEAPVGEKSRRDFRIEVPRDWQPGSPRFAVAADVICDGQYLGRSPRPWSTLVHEPGFTSTSPLRLPCPFSCFL